MKKFYKNAFTILLVGICISLQSQVATFNYTGGQQSWVVPNCCNSVTVDVQGAYGGSNNCNTGGLGGRVQATLPVTPGQTLYIFCGQGNGNNVSICNGTYNGGGSPWNCGGSYGGAGGGASDIRIGGTALTDRKIVAGGGGGAASTYYTCNGTGGSGGGLIGNNGWYNNSYSSCYCGMGGTQSAGGGGAQCYGCCTGTLGQGANSGPYSGAGGGGYYGGGGGYYGGGGGGGSSYTASNVTGVTHTQGFRSGDGVVVITPLIGQEPPASIAGSTLVCPGNSNTYSVTPLTGVTSYTWTVPTGTTIVSGQGTSSIVATIGATSGNIGVSATGPCGTSTVRTLAIIFANFFASPVTSANPSAVCLGSTSQLSAISGDSIKWWTAATGGTLLGTSASAANFPVTPLSTTTYYAGTRQGTAPITLNDTLNFTGTFQTWTVPAGVTSITVKVNGAEGGNNTQGPNNLGGEGGVVQGTYAVTPGQALRIYVGGTTTSITGGWNGGGNGGPNNNGQYSRGGGGGSDIRVSPYGLANRIFVGAGGGGGGWNCSDNNKGGKGGGLIGENGYQCNNLQTNTNGGTQSAGGVSTNGCGSSGVTWAGGSCSDYAGGGGGGGYYGGAAGCYGGGAGGSNFANSTATAVTHTQGTRNGNGIVIITYVSTIPVCAAVTRTPVLVTVNALPVVTSSSSPASICVGGTASLSASGASTYNWMPGNINGSTVFVTPTTTTTYTVTGTNTNGCTGTSSRTIVVNTLPVVTATSSSAVVCAGSSVTLTGGGASSYLWSGGVTNAVSFVPTATATYTVTGTNANGCSNTATTSVTVNAVPTVTATISAATVCAGTSVTLSATGAVSYNWMPGNFNGASVTTAATSTTTYTVTGTGSNGCTNTAVTTVTVNPNPTVNANSSAPSICLGSSVTLTGGGASTYAWSAGVTDGVPFAPTSTLTYTVTGTDANGCSGSATTTVVVNALPVVTTSVSNPVICAGNSTTISATGGFYYSWTPGNLFGPSVSVSPMSSTAYVVTVTNLNGCTNTGMAIVTVNPLPVVTANSTAASVCTGGSVTLTGGGATSYVWNNNVVNAVSFVPTATATYMVTGTNANGCVNTATTTVTVNPLPVVTATSSAAAVCAGASVTLTGGGATSYMWTNNVMNAVSFVPSATATYVVTGTNANGCINTASVTVTVNALPTVTANSTSAAVCAGGSVTLTGGGATSYTWNNNVMNAVSFVPTATTTYMVTGTDANGCVNTASTTVAVNANPVVALGADVVQCAGSATFNAGNNGSTYMWSNSATTQSITVTASGTYIAMVTNINGCMGSDTVMATINALPVVSLGPDIAQCGPVNFDAGNIGSVYVWNTTDSTQMITASTSGTYYVDVTDVNGCTSSDTVMAMLNPLPVLTLADVTQCGGSVLLDAGNVGAMYMWSTADSVQTITVSTTGTYYVDVTDSLGCMNSDTAMVTIYALPTVTGSASSAVVCVDDSTVTLTGTPTGGVWTGPGVTGSNLDPVTAGVGTHVATYTYQDSLGCEGTASVSVQVNACVGFVENTLSNGVSVYPNPNNGSFTLSINANVADLTIKITDMQGRVVYASVENNVNAGFVKQISLDTQSSGMYLMHIITNGEQQTKKISVQK